MRPVEFAQTPAATSTTNMTALRASAIHKIRCCALVSAGVGPHPQSDIWSVYRTGGPPTNLQSNALSHLVLEQPKPTILNDGFLPMLAAQNRPHYGIAFEAAFWIGARSIRAADAMVMSVLCLGCKNHPISAVPINTSNEPHLRAGFSHRISTTTILKNVEWVAYKYIRREAHGFMPARYWLDHPQSSPVIQL